MKRSILTIMFTATAIILAPNLDSGGSNIGLEARAQPGNGNGGSGNGNASPGKGEGSASGNVTAEAARDPSTRGVEKALAVVETNNASENARTTLGDVLDKLLGRKSSE